MPKMGTPKDSLKPPEQVPPGIYEVRLDSFSPKLTKPRDDKVQSVNYRPQMKIINCAGVDAEGKPLNGRAVYDYVNQNAGWIVEAFAHAFGFKLVEEDGVLTLPGTWTPNPSDPDNVEKFTYSGPMLGATGRLEYVELVNPTTNKKFMAVKQYLCKVQGCTTKHKDDLTKQS